MYTKCINFHHNNNNLALTLFVSSILMRLLFLSLKSMYIRAFISVFLAKNVQNKKQTIQSMSFFALFIFFFQKHSALMPIFNLFEKNQAWERYVFDEKLKLKNKLYYYRCFICALFLIFFPPNTPVSCPFFLNRHESTLFLMNNVPNQKYANIDVFPCKILVYFPSSKRSQQPPNRNSQKNMKI